MKETRLLVLNNCEAEALLNSQQEFEDYLITEFETNHIETERENELGDFFSKEQKLDFLKKSGFDSDYEIEEYDFDGEKDRFAYKGFGTSQHSDFVKLKDKLLSMSKEEVIEYVEEIKNKFSFVCDGNDFFEYKVEGSEYYEIQVNLETGEVVG